MILYFLKSQSHLCYFRLHLHYISSGLFSQACPFPPSRLSCFLSGSSLFCPLHGARMIFWKKKDSVMLNSFISLEVCSDVQFTTKKAQNHMGCAIILFHKPSTISTHKCTLHTSQRYIPVDFLEYFMPSKLPCFAQTIPFIVWNGHHSFSHLVN